MNCFINVLYFTIDKLLKFLNVTILGKNTILQFYKPEFPHMRLDKTVFLMLGTLRKNCPQVKLVATTKIHIYVVLQDIQDHSV